MRLRVSLASGGGIHHKISPPAGYYETSRAMLRPDLTPEQFLAPFAVQYRSYNILKLSDELAQSTVYCDFDCTHHQRAFQLTSRTHSRCISFVRRRGFKFLLNPQAKPIHLKEDALFPAPKTIDPKIQFLPRPTEEYNALVVKSQQDEEKKQVENMRVATLRVRRAPSPRTLLLANFATDLAR
eukprot:817484-Prorocentrum_minimum.AAC.2